MSELRTIVIYKDDGHTRTDESLLEHAVKHAGDRSTQRSYRWCHVGSLLSLGSTSAWNVCRRFNIDPDELLGGCNQCEATETRVCECNAKEYEIEP